MSDVTLEPRPVSLAATGGEVADYVALLKPRVMSLVLFSGITGLVIAPGALHPLLAGVAILCIALGAGASGALNMWFERDIDALMARTRNRPLPAGRLAPESALQFGVALAVGSVALMGVAVNWVAAAVLAFTIGFYLLVYTMWLKRRTPQNIVIGGAAGALPPVVGWVAATGEITLEPLILFAIIFFWTPPHFWALALFRAGDYSRAGIPMLPVVAGPRATKRQMLLYTLVLLPVALLPSMIGMAGVIYGVGVGLLGVMFVFSAVRVLGDKADRSAKRMFGFSILYLFGLLSLLIVDHYVGLFL
jgi:protoheme IX farnesyltransferase